ncbi:MAG: hypothetical protein CMO81_08130 [Waddliaceae bacterium]|nr:hypothetical protein [Waddliaceae bacterium]
MNINPQLIIRRLVDGNDELLIPARDLQITDEASTFKREGFLSVGKTTNRIVDHLISLLPFSSLPVFH